MFKLAIFYRLAALFQQLFNNKYYSHMTDSTVNWRLAQRNCISLNVETDLCEDFTGLHRVPRLSLSQV